MEAITWAQGSTQGSGGCKRVVMGAWAVMPVVLGKPKAGLWVALEPEKDKGTCLPSNPVFPAEFGKEKSVPLNNLTVDEVAKALENIVKSKA